MRARLHFRELLMVAWATCATALALAVFMGVLSGCSYDVATPDEMQTRFSTHRTEFSELVRMAGEDSDFELYEDPSLPQSGNLDAGRASTYGQLLESLGAAGITARDGEPQVILGMGGLAVSGVEWGYYYSSTGEPLSEEDSGYESTAVGDGWFAYVYWF